MKKFLSVILSIIIVTSLAFPVTAVSPSSRLFEIYGDGMLFQQKKEAVFSGTGNGGDVILAELYDGCELIASGKSTTNRSGFFKVGFTAPAGSYKQYTVKLYENKVLFRELKDVVFGELWLASGQSNMSYGLSSEKTGSQMYAEGKALNEWVRVLNMGELVTFKGSQELTPVEPQKDIAGAHWVKGNEGGIYSVSAVACFFAEELRQKLDMPVGILNASLGGSSISSWLSREAIDSDGSVKQNLINHPSYPYIEYGNWNEKAVSRYYDMTSNFNVKISPLTVFKPAGMIWYQGETDCIFGWDNNAYSEAFDLLQRSYSEYFDCDGLLPVVFTSLASCAYSNELNNLNMNLLFTEIQQARPESRALISIYDIDHSFADSLGFIHPAEKKPIGERMAYSAEGLVYNPCDTYTTATVKSVQICDNGINVKFRNVGKGLKSNGEKLFGFSVCGSNGVYTVADASIVSEDTVHISSEYIKEPKSAVYANSLSNINSNLYAEGENGVLIPVACFVTDKAYSERYVKFVDWADCEKEDEWRVIVPMDESRRVKLWEAENTVISYEKASAFSGENGLRAASTKKSFSLAPVFGYKNKARYTPFTDMETDYSDYGSLVFKIKNNGNNPVELSSVKFNINAVVWYSAFVDESIPADGEWHTVSVDLNSLCLWNEKNGIVYSNEKLKAIRNFKLEFNCEKSADLSLDEFRFTPDLTENGDTTPSALEILNLLSDFLTRFFNWFIN